MWACERPGTLSAFGLTFWGGKNMSSVVSKSNEKIDTDVMYIRRPVTLA